MASADWLLEVGVDTSVAKGTLLEFKKFAEGQLGGLGKTVNIRVNTETMTEQTQKAIKQLSASIKGLPNVNLNFNLNGASKSLNAFGTAINTHSGSIKNFTSMLEDLTIKAERSREVLSEQAVTLRESAESIRTISNYLRNASENTLLATRSNEIYTRSIEAINRANATGYSSSASFSGSIRQVGDASLEASGKHKVQHDAIERLGKIVDNTVFKFVEYEIIMRAFNGVVHEFTSSLNEASNVQFESTLQKLYAPTVNLNDALSDAIIIAKQYGSDITDVQQAIGLWTKLTQDETSAAYLAMEAEKLRRISGIETLDVFKDSVAILKQMGLAAKDLPGVYDQIAAAALRIAEPLKNMGKGGAEGVKDMMDGLTRFGAVGKGIGLDTTGIIALTANQVQSSAEGGKSEGNALSNMVGALDTGSKSKANFDAILKSSGMLGGADDYEKSLNVMKAMEKEAPKLAQAMADGLIRTKPGQVETFKTLEASIKGTIELMEYLHKSSAGKLDLITDSEMKTFQGRMDQLKAGIQSFSLTFGQKLLPAANSFALVLSQNVLPAFTANIGVITGLGRALGTLAIASLLAQSFGRLGGAFSTFAVQSRAVQQALNNQNATMFAAKTAEFDNIAAMTTTQAEMDLTAAASGRLAAAFRVMGESAGFAGKDLSAYVDYELEAARQSGALTTAIDLERIAMNNAKLSAGGMLTNLGNIANRALGMIGPLAALSLAFWGVQEAMSGASTAGASDLGFDERKYDNAQKSRNPLQKLVNIAGDKGIPGMFSLGLRESSANAAGQDKDAGWKYVNNISRSHNAEGRLALDSLQRLKGKDKGNERATDDDLDILKRIAQSHFQEDNYTRKYNRIQQLIEQAKNDHAPGYVDKQSNPGGATTESDGTTKGAASPESQVMGDIQRTTKEFQARATEARDNAAAEKELADAILERTKATGVSAKDLTAYSNALKEQAKDINNELYIREEEAKALKKVSDNANALARGADPKTTKGQHAKNDATAAQANLDKTNGAINLLREQYRLLIAQDANLRASMALTYDIHANGLDNATDKIEQIKKNVSNQTDYAGTSLATTSGTATLQAMLKHAQAVANDPKISVDAETLQKARKAVEDIKDAIAALGKTEEEATAKAQGFSDSLKSIKDNVYAENTADIAKALGIDTGSMDALNTQIEMYRKMAEEITSAKRDFDGSQKTPADIANYSSTINEIRERAELAPILAQEAKLKADIKKTEDSSTYKMVDAEVKKYGDKTIDQIMKPLGTGFGGSMITGVLKDAWSQASKSITDSMFGVDKEKEKELALQEIYKEHVDGLQVAAQEFRGIVNDMIIALEKVPGGSTEPGMDNYGTDNTSTLGISNPSHALASMDYASATNNSVLKAIQGTDTNHADDALATAQESRDYLAILSGQDGSRSGGTPSIANLGDLSSSAGIGGAPTDGIPVKIASIASGGASSAASVVIPGVSSALGGVMKDAGLGGSKNPLSSLLSGGLPAFNKTLSGGISKIMGNGGLTMGDIGLGIGVGSLSGSLFGGGSHTTNGELGGIAGSGLGALGTALGIFGPGGAIIGALAGGMLGGMFGHKDDPSKMPDKFDTNFAQETANLTGKSYTSEASGQQFMSAGVAGSTGGQGEISSIEELLAKYPNPQDAPAWLQPYYAQALKTFGASSTGSGVLKFGKNIANEHIEGAAGASTTDQNYQGINSLADQIEQAKALHTNQAQAPILSINAYGTNGSYGNSIYNTPGLTSDQFNAIQGNAFQGANLNNYYGTPGVGTSTASGNSMRSLESGSAAATLGSAVNITTNLVVDGQTLATIVNSANSALASRTSSA